MGMTRVTGIKRVTLVNREEGGFVSTFVVNNPEVFEHVVAENYTSYAIFGKMEYLDQVKEMEDWEAKIYGEYAY